MRSTPVTVVSGFLGAGKSSLVQHVLRHSGGRRLALLVNDFGEIDVDGRVLGSSGSPIVSLPNGCICCSTQDGLVRGLETVLSASGVDQIVIEASGLSLLGNIVRTLRRPELESLVHVGATVVVLDSASVGGMSGEARYIVREQLADADIVVMNKTDLVSPSQIETLREEWIPPSAEVIPTAHGRVEPALLLGIARPDVRRVADEPGDQPGVLGFSHWTWWPERRVESAMLRSVLCRLPMSCRRVKGFVDLANPEVRALVQVVGLRVDIRRSGDDDAPNALVIIDERRSSRDTLEPMLDRCLQRV